MNHFTTCEWFVFGLFLFFKYVDSKNIIRDPKLVHIRQMYLTLLLILIGNLYLNGMWFHVAPRTQSSTCKGFDFTKTPSFAMDEFTKVPQTPSRQCKMGTWCMVFDVTYYLESYFILSHIKFLSTKVYNVRTAYLTFIDSKTDVLCIALYTMKKLYYHEATCNGRYLQCLEKLTSWRR